MGDCKLCVASSDGHIRFQSIGESAIAEPDLARPDHSLVQQMSYSLHPNIVTNSLHSEAISFKSYRREEIPLELEPGDTVFIYSDGVDDLFTPLELLSMRRNGEGGEGFVRRLLALSARRMRHIRSMLEEAQLELPPDEQMRAYPVVHQRVNEERLQRGFYEERYPDGLVGRWMKPPQCDNTAVLVMTVGGRG